MGIRTCRWSVCSLSVSHGQAEGHVTQARRRGRFPALAFDSTQQSGVDGLVVVLLGGRPKTTKREETKRDFVFFFFFSFYSRSSSGELVNHPLGPDRRFCEIHIYIKRERARASFLSTLKNNRYSWKGQAKNSDI